MGVKLTAAAAAAVVAFSGMAASATTIDADPAQNEVDIDYTGAGADVVLGDPFNLFLNPVDVSGSFDQDNVDGSLRFAVYSDPASQGAAGRIQLNFTNENGTFGSDNETFSGSFGGAPLNFMSAGGGVFANFDTSLLGTSPATATEFFLDFSGFDLGDQFQVNVARVAAIPIPASLTLLLGALCGLGYVSRRRHS